MNSCKKSGGEITSMTERTTGPVTRLRLAQVFECEVCKKQLAATSFWRKARKGVFLQGVPIYYNDKGLSEGPHKENACCQWCRLDVCGGSMQKKPKTIVNNRLLLQHKKDHQNLLCQI